jgi:hypothetical protein
LVAMSGGPELVERFSGRMVAYGARRAAPPQTRMNPSCLAEGASAWSVQSMRVCDSTVLTYPQSHPQKTMELVGRRWLAKS